MTLVLLITESPLSQVLYTESEVNLEKIFIEANREKLLGNYENAITLYKEVLKSDKENHAALYELGRIYETTGEEDKAIKSVKSAIQQDPENIWYQKFLADIYQKTGQNLEAAEIYEDLAKEEPNNEYYYFKWAYFLVRANEIEKAVKVYDGLEKKIGINEEIIRRKHSLYLGTGDNKKAAKELERLIDAFPTVIEYRHLLANFYEQIGEKSQAEKIYRDILKLAPNDPKANLAMAGMNNKTNDDIKYLASLKPIFSKEDVNIDLKIGKLLPIITKVASTGDRELAMAALELTETLEVVHPADPKPLSASGDLLYHSGQPEKALEKYLATVELNPNVFSVWEQIMYIHLEAKNYKALEKVSEEVMDLFPNKGLAYYMHGSALAEQGQDKQAIDMFEQALMMSGRDGRLQFEIQSRLGQSYARLKQFDQSDKAFEAALELNPKAPQVLNDFSYSLASRNEQLEKALMMSARSNDLISTNASYQDTYGWIFYKLKEFKSAKEWINKAITNGGGEDPDILEHYGDVLFQLDEIDNAIQYWIKAQQKGSKSELLEKKISDRQLYE